MKTLGEEPDLVEEGERCPGEARPTYPPGSAAQLGNDSFNYTYTGLLKVLHDTLNGHPDQIDTAIGMMMSRRQQAMDMASGTSTANKRRRGQPTGTACLGSQCS